MILNLTSIGENPDKLKSNDIGEIDDLDNIVQNAYIWHNDGQRW